MACNCPLATAQTTITPTTCEFNINQIHRVWEVRAGNVIWDISTPANNLPAALVGLAPEDIAGWTALKTDATSAKVLFLPLFGGEPLITPGEEITFGGGGNDTLNGKTQHIGFSPSEFSARYDGLEAQQESDIDEIVCEGDDVEVYFVLYDGTILGSLDAATSNIFTGIDVESALVLLGRNVAGFSAKDSNVFKFQMNKDWSKTMHKITPTFSALTGI
jgi:hypothetical protein